ncbi:MAG: DUF3152 domain-containing protein [Propioniciclava sp.]
MSAKPQRVATAPPGRNAWRGVLVLILLVVISGVVWVYWGPGRDRGSGIGGPSASVTPTPTPTHTIPAIARQEVWISDTPASGEYATNTEAIASGTSNERVVDYVVRVETSVPAVDPDVAAREIQATLDDSRGWAGYGRTSFRAVTEVGEDTLVITLASPDTAQELCQPLDIERKWNCRVKNTVVLNSDRWLYMTPTYDDLTRYRSYMVNHEVGHFLGQAHVGCPKEGAPAPVMMQQSIKLDGCVPNAWPRDAD